MDSRPPSLSSPPDAPRAAPSGLVTLVFTAVQGERTLWERAPVEMQAAMDLHDALMRVWVEAHGGYEVKKEHGGFMVAFPDAAAAVRCCLAVQEALMEARLPDALTAMPELAEAPGIRGLRVQMGAHIDEPLARLNPVSGRMDYYGAGVHRAARLAQAAAGGQVLLSGALWAEVRASLEPELVFAELGEHRLRGLEGMEHVVGVLSAGLSARGFAPLTGVAPGQTNLPEHPTTFVGREADRRRLEQQLAAGARIVSLHGPPGVGKTRLALNYGGRWLDAYSAEGAGVWVCELIRASSSNGVLLSVAEALGVPLTAPRSSEANVVQLGHALRSRGRVLLILDGFDLAASHAPATLGRWLNMAPDARFLVTSRERLRMEGEVTLELGPMTETDAVQLFVERARAVRPTLGIPEDEEDAIRQLVGRLDRLPLAIELAAARVDHWTPRALLGQLSRRLDLQGAAQRGAHVASLRTALDLSWDLLGEWEQDALAQCSVFHGGFDVEAAEAVLDLTAHEGSPWALDAVEALRDRSLLRAEEPPGFPGEVRFSLLGMVREYAEEQLEATRHMFEVDHRHRAWYVPLGESLAAGVDGPDGSRMLRRLALEAENLEAAHLSAMRLPRAPAEAVRALLALDKLFQARGPLDAHLAMLDRAVAASAEATAELRVRALLARADARTRRGLMPQASADLEEARFWLNQARDRPLTVRCALQEARLLRLSGRADEAEAPLRLAFELARELGNLELEGQTHAVRGLVHVTLGRLQEGLGDLERAVRIFRQRGMRLAESAAKANQGAVHLMLAEYDRAETELRESAQIAEDAEHTNTLVSIYANLAVLYMDLGRWNEARDHFTRTLALSRRAGSMRDEAMCLAMFGVLLLERDETRAAEAHLRRALESARGAHDRLAEGLALANLALVRQVRGHPAEAVVLQEDAIALLSAVGHRSAAALASAFLAGGLAELGRLDAATSALTQARELASGHPAANLSAVLDLCEGRLEVAVAAAARARGETHLSHLHETHARHILETSRIPQGPRPEHPRGLLAPLARSVDARLAAGMLERMLEERSA